MHPQRRLSEQQEEICREGLRILARIIARHYLTHRQVYLDQDQESVEGTSNEATTTGAEGEAETRACLGTDQPPQHEPERARTTGQDLVRLSLPTDQRTEESLPRRPQASPGSARDRTVRGSVHPGIQR